MSNHLTKMYSIAGKNTRMYKMSNHLTKMKL